MGTSGPVGGREEGGYAIVIQGAEVSLHPLYIQKFPCAGSVDMTSCIMEKKLAILGYRVYNGSIQ